MPDPTPDALQRLLAHREIQDLAIRYCRAIDRHDWAAMRALYHADATDDHGSLFQGPASEYIDWLPSMAQKMHATFHQVGNHLIAWRGDRAEGEVYVVACHLKTGADGQEEQVITGGRYLDRYTRRDGAWKFQSRKAVMDWNEVQPSLRRWPLTGARGQQDPAWDFFEFLGK
ncbi:MAG: nuclear transport factor 2 family protein [Pseudomonadota bacterium]